MGNLRVWTSIPVSTCRPGAAVCRHSDVRPSGTESEPARPGQPPKNTKIGRPVFFGIYPVMWTSQTPRRHSPSSRHTTRHMSELLKHTCGRAPNYSQIRGTPTGIITATLLPPISGHINPCTARSLAPAVWLGLSQQPLSSSISQGDFTDGRVAICACRGKKNCVCANEPTGACGAGFLIRAAGSSPGSSGVKLSRQAGRESAGR